MYQNRKKELHLVSVGYSEGSRWGSPSSSFLTVAGNEATLTVPLQYVSKKMFKEITATLFLKN